MDRLTGQVEETAEQRPHAAASSDSRAQAGATAHPQRALTVITASLLLYMLVMVFAYPLRTGSDVGLLLDLGTRVLLGERPNVDYDEINLPTNSYFHAVPAGIARATGLHPVLVFNLLTWAAVVWGAYASARLTALARAQWLLQRVPPALIPLMLALASLFYQTAVIFGQREHLFILFAVPWLLLRWLRWEGALLPRGFALAVGVLAGAGLGLKPHFVPIVLVTELLALAQHRRIRPLWAPEIGAVAMVAVLYAAPLVLSPEGIDRYLNVILANAATSYDTYGYYPPLVLLFENEFSLASLAVQSAAFAVGTLRRGAFGRLLQYVSAAGLMASLMFAVQTKGFLYHNLPAITLLAITAVLLIAYSAGRAERRASVLGVRGVLGTAAVLGIGGLVFLSIYMHDLKPLGEADERQPPLLQFSQRGDRVLFVDHEISIPYPSVTQLGRVSVGRYPVAYPLKYAYPGTRPDDPAVYAPGHVPPPLVQEYLARLAWEIETLQPPLILLRSSGCHQRPCVGVVAAPYILSRPEVAPLLEAAYDDRGVVGDYRVFTRKGL